MVSIGVTLALDPVTAFETNVVVLGNVKIDLIDEYIGREDPYDEDHPPQFNPGATVDKVVAVENTGAHPCYVRVGVNKKWLDNNNRNIASYITLNINQAYWFESNETIQDNDGVEYQLFYYKDELGVGDRTESLFETFKIKDYAVLGETAAVGGSVGSITVIAQAVQSEHVSVAAADFHGTEKEGTIERDTIPIDEDTSVDYIVNWNGLTFS